MTRLILAALVILLGISAASASPSCMTLREARHVYPTKHLWWHGDHCWVDQHLARVGSSRSKRTAVVVPLPPERPARQVAEAVVQEPPMAVQQTELDWRDRWPAIVKAADQPAPKAAIVKASFPDRTPGILFLALVIAALTFTVLEVLFGDKVFNRQHLLAMRYGYYT